MRKFISTALVAIYFLTSFAQSEFQVYENGLIYSPTAMKQLHHIVDSLNIKFRRCEFNKTFYSKPQARAHYIEVSGAQARIVLQELKDGIDWTELKKKYSFDTKYEDLLVVKHQYRDDDEDEVTKLSSISPGEGNNKNVFMKIESSKYYGTGRAQWVWQYGEKSDYSDESLDAFYFLTDMASMPLDNSYASLIQYSDCMVDTNTTVFLDGVKNKNGWESDGPNEDVEAFLSMVDLKFPGKPSFPESPDDYKDEKAMNKYYAKVESYEKAYRTWDSLRLEKLDRTIARTDKFRVLLDSALASALKSGGSNNSFEFYVAKYCSKEQALQLKRSRIVIGGCSMDMAPRAHAQNIAILSAEAVNWEVFLRAHLDIMNDRFQRASDGNYAWGSRNTYIRELEELDINVKDLLLGICLRTENTAKNHYYGNIQRVGRALSETQYKSEVEEKILAMIADPRLDDYNRVVMYYLLVNYTNYMPDDTREANRLMVEKAKASLPTYLASKAERKK